MCSLFTAVLWLFFTGVAMLLRWLGEGIRREEKIDRPKPTELQGQPSFFAAGRCHRAAHDGISPEWAGRVGGSDLSYAIVKTAEANIR